MFEGVQTPRISDVDPGTRPDQDQGIFHLVRIRCGMQRRADGAAAIVYIGSQVYEPLDIAAKTSCMFMQGGIPPGVSRLQVGLELDGNPLPTPNTDFWPVYQQQQRIGRVTSAIYSPRLEANIALAMLGIDHCAIGSQVEVDTGFGRRGARVVPRPFYDPGKNLPRG